MRALAVPVWRSVRTYATGRQARPGTTLSLEHFIQRARALALYRSILRSTRQIADARTRAETRRFARDEFERHRGVTDIDHTRYLLSTGKTEWESMERYINGL
ncbi:complex 1 protein-domain-containing protein [Chaetomium strumarium]|uniref:LYR motif-containing protein 2 n=1 Tax=Chaetomium strumarium TaxID=1170767 RepID=A0AAJ0M1D6_9PEZI|nr:complex 1 protein-domain-containing protein [Chaetomium strumarium]